jgi:hypothetical protein
MLWHLPRLLLEIYPNPTDSFPPINYCIEVYKVSVCVCVCVCVILFLSTFFSLKYSFESPFDTNNMYKGTAPCPVRSVTLVHNL